MLKFLDNLEKVCTFLTKSEMVFQICFKLLIVISTKGDKRRNITKYGIDTIFVCQCQYFS